MSRTEAVDTMYQDMAARHRARFRSIHVSRRLLLRPLNRKPTTYLVYLLDSSSRRD